MNAPTRLVGWLGWACMAAAVLSGILQGLWEMAHPILLSDSTFAFASATQRWGYATLSVIKSLGFFAGLIVVGILNSQIFVRLKPDMALIVQGIIWLILGYVVYVSRSRTEQIHGADSAGLASA